MDASTHTGSELAGLPKSSYHPTSNAKSCIEIPGRAVNPGKLIALLKTNFGLGAYDIMMARNKYIITTPRQLATYDIAGLRRSYCFEININFGHRIKVPCARTRDGCKEGTTPQWCGLFWKCT
ncbi:hypothetical protein EDD36DRAFT_57906 [Exophiala viscosa]|uniref:Uncharacterized protein n=1 Tax=Exophiala viscosa TaxID=2486360 RepID=A0AAN6DS54_9EURO|nr:hypothetical protein EDD36DRAFT_57906 [Exophiala viscosa]